MCLFYTCKNENLPQIKFAGIKMPKLKAICFDMDGIIVNSEPYHFKSTQLALKKEGFNYSQEQGKFFVGKTVKEKYL